MVGQSQLDNPMSRSSRKRSCRSPDIASEFADTLKSVWGDKIKKMVLFGSRAKGTFLKNSDYDIAIVLEERDSQMIDQIYDYVLDFLLKYEVDISLKIYSEDDYKRKSALQTPFLREIEKTGITL